jgi:tripartite-type tricarboxylate transporter receptor subunit TctC
MIKSFRFPLAAIVGVALIAGPLGANGQEFYQGKTINFVVGYSAGGIFDTYTRLIARHFGRHVPGSPLTIVQNMTGAGGIIAANYLYGQAKPDGLTIGAWASPQVLQNVLGNDATKFDGRKFGWLGVPAAYDTLCAFNEASGVKTTEDWMAAKRPLKISGIAPGTGPSDVPKLAKAALGLPIQVVDGFKGGADSRLAVESGEVDGYCGSWQSVKTVWRRAFESGKVRLALQLTLQSHPEIKHIPLAINYAKTADARLFLKVADNAYRLQFPYSVPPGAPRDRLQILQKAFIETLRDPQLLAEAKKADLEIEPVDGTTTANTLGGLYEVDPATTAKLKEILIPKK